MFQSLASLPFALLVNVALGAGIKSFSALTLNGVTCSTRMTNASTNQQLRLPFCGE
jgi:hypothetical protein